MPNGLRLCVLKAQFHIWRFHIWLYLCTGRFIQSLLFLNVLICRCHFLKQIQQKIKSDLIIREIVVSSLDNVSLQQRTWNHVVQAYPETLK